MPAVFHSVNYTLGVHLSQLMPSLCRLADELTSNTGQKSPPPTLSHCALRQTQKPTPQAPIPGAESN